MAVFVGMTANSYAFQGHNPLCEYNLCKKKYDLPNRYVDHFSFQLELV
jgi:hypothetical protein